MRTNLLAEDLDRAAGRRDDAERHSDRRRLPRSVWPEKSEKLGLIDLEVEPVDRQPFAVGLGQRLSAKYRLRGAHCESSTARAGFVTVGLV